MQVYIIAYGTFNLNSVTGIDSGCIGRISNGDDGFIGSGFFSARKNKAGENGNK